MSDQNIQGVDLGVGKLSVPLTLASVSGPNSFGETLTLQYSSLGLLSQIRTWNEEIHSDVLGLGWCISEQYIMRVGNGSLDDQFIWSQDSAQALVLKSKTVDDSGIYTLEFATVTKTLNQITYQTIPNDVNSPELWTIVDANGVTYTYGGNQAAIDWGVRWVSTDGVSPLVWIGTSTATQNQVNYALMWHLSSKENIYGQRVDYDYFSIKYNVGPNGQGLSYTMASYLQGVRVANGGSITLSYADKNSWEYPALRFLMNTSDSGSYGVTNAYQDRIVTKYLQLASIYNSEGNLQSVVELGYDFLFMNFPGLEAGTATLQAMQKRVLTSVSYLSASGQIQKPAQLFDYWGLNDGASLQYSTNPSYPIDQTNLLILTDASLTATYNYTDNYQQAHSFGALFGHLKTATTSLGAVTWYSYREVSQNYAQVSWPTLNAQGQSFDWDSNWKNQLDLDNIPWPEGDWQNPRPFWGADNYVVVVWDTVHNTDNSNNTIALTIFEWMGSWIPVYVTQWGQGVGTTFGVSSDFRDYGEECIKFGMGSGKFVLCRLGISASTTSMGLITIFNRDPYLPGVWNLTSMLNSGDTNLSTNFAITTPDDDGIYLYQQLEVNVGTHIVSVLDKTGQMLYLYSLINNNWVPYYTDSSTLGIPLLQDGGVINPAGFGSVVNNDDVFIFACPNVSGNTGFQQGFYWLYRFDITQPQASAWQSITQVQSSLQMVVYDGDPYSLTQGFVISPMVNGVYLAQGFIKEDEESTVNSYYGMPFAISWNIPTSDTSGWQVNLQKILSPNGNDNNASEWGFLLQTESLGKGSGSMMTSNLVNIIPVGTGGVVGTRYLTRYAGSGTYDNVNPGWVGDPNFLVRSDDSDQWCQLATLDTTVEVNTTDSDTYGYNFYQFTPYGNKDSTTHPYWIEQSNVSGAMGYNTDWEAIMATVNEVLMLVGVFFQGISMWLFLPGIAVAEAISAVSNLLKWAVRAYEIADFMINNVAGLAAQFVLAPIAKNALAGRNEGSDMGMKYLMVGQGNVGDYPNDLPLPPQAFAKVWEPTTQSWTWQSVSTFDASVPQNNALVAVPWQNWGNTNYEATVSAFLGQDLYSYGDSFIPFSYVAYGHRDFGVPFTDSYLRGFYCDQVAFFQNGQCLGVDMMPKFMAGPFEDGLYPSNSFHYMFYNDVVDDQPTPVMCAPWGGILGYQPIINAYHKGGAFTDDYAWASNSDFPIRGVSIPSDCVKPSLATAQGLALTMARDGLLSGAMTDYVVDQVVIDDGYQTYNTFFQYMPNNAVYQPIESVVYNQVRVAQGGADYTSSAIANGWSEYYFYNGGFNYYQSTQPEGTNALPYDPSGSTDIFSFANQNQTNVSQYFSLVTGKMYCQRTLKSQDGSSDFSEGYEVARQQIFYQGFEDYLTYDSNNNPTTQQKVVGALPTLTVSYTAPSNTTTADITDAYAEGSATLKSSYYFYDIAYIDRQKNAQNLYGPVTPADADTPYQLGLNSALNLGKLSFNYHQTAVQSALAIEARYTQILPGVAVTQQNDQASSYQQFSNLNLFNTNVQTTTWYHPTVLPAVLLPPTLHVPPTILNFATPASAWGDANGINWQVIASNTRAWQTFTTNWYPASTYAWQGNSDGSPQTQPWIDDTTDAFPWTAPPSNSANTVWLQQGSVATDVTASGIVLASQTNTEVPSYTVYDQQFRWPIASIMNAGTYGASLGFYTGFETYEDLSSWSLNSNALDSAAVFSPMSYAGNRSLMISATASTANTLSISLPTVTPNQAIWLLAPTILLQTTSTGVSLTLQVIATLAGSSQTSTLYNQTITPTTSWVNYCLPIDLSTLTSAVTSLSLVVTSSVDATVYIDNVYLVPAQDTQFTFQSYDLATLAPLASASPQDPGFCNRKIYASNGLAIGSVRKATQSASDTQWFGQPTVAAKIQLNTTYFSRNGYANSDDFSATDPNSALQIVAGANQPAAGVYFDFRDGLNPWTGGSVSANARSLLLDVSQSATYDIPTNLNWGVGIRAQIQGYIEPVASISLTANSVASTPQSVSMPTASVSDCFHLYGAYSDGSTMPADLYAFDISLDTSGPETINQSTTVSISSGTPVMSNQQLLTCNALQAIPNPGVTSSVGDLLFGTFVSNGQYSVTNFSEVQNIEIYTDSTSSIYLPMAASNNLVYFADEATALYVTDVTNCVNQPNSGFSPTPVVTYNDLLANAICPLAPTMDRTKTSMAWLLTTTSPAVSTSQALQFTQGQTGTAQVVDAANVMNFNYDEDFTIECWVNVPLTQYTYIASRWSMEVGNHAYPYVIRVYSTGCVNAARYDLAENNPSVMSTTSIFDGNFHHIAFVRTTDASGQGQLLLYIDGVLEASGIDNTTVSTQSDAPLILNHTLYNSEQTEGSQIAELRVWNYARTSTQINVDIKRQLTGYEAGLVGYWPFNGSADDLTLYQQNMVLSSSTDCVYTNLPSSNMLPAPTSVWVKYDTALDQLSTWVIGSKGDALPNVTLPPTVSADGAVFVASVDYIYAYDTNLAFVAGVQVGTIAGQITAGNSRVFVATTTGTLFIYDETLNLIMSVDTGLTINASPILHGNKVSVVGQLNNQWVIATYTMTGLLVTQPYTVPNVQTTVSIQAFAPNLPSLCVMVDNITFMRLDFGVPVGTSIGLGNYTVLYTQDSSTGVYQYQLQQSGSILNTVSLGTLNEAIGDWWLMVIGTTLYFYADSEQIFAYALSDTSLPEGSFTLTAGSDSGISCRDIVVLTDPTVVNQFSDGAGKSRQTQTLATVN